MTLTWRTEVTAADVAKIRDLCAKTGFFSPAEVTMSGELVEARLDDGDASDYDFIIAEIDGALAGYTCFGHIEGTESAFDLFWIAVDPAQQGHGIGRQLLARTEAIIVAAGGSRYYAETSSTPAYEPTRQFYLRTGFREVAHVKDFYKPGDGKLIYERVV